ncbi:hypothetical protein AVEN_20099-1 [Araneus ventricosus]|uniref:Uncharacterized protein n=1 Tax=Araneus ventricosus TaxID=182803 RepID=A0A4Y2M4N3_ARAVE|nr:hypothetical protein AVEN_20099-1 [Araneus ventricosus]
MRASKTCHELAVNPLWAKRFSKRISRIIQINSEKSLYKGLEHWRIPFHFIFVTFGRHGSSVTGNMTRSYDEKRLLKNYRKRIVSLLVLSRGYLLPVAKVYICTASKAASTYQQEQNGPFQDIASPYSAKPTKEVVNMLDWEAFSHLPHS